MKETGPLILLTNDDGIHAEGLRNLKIVAERIGRPGEIAMPVECDRELEQAQVFHALIVSITSNQCIGRNAAADPRI